MELRTAGAYSRRAEKHTTAGEYDMAILDLIRALSRKGLQPDIREKFERNLNGAIRGLGRQRKKEDKIRAEAEKAEARKNMEIEALKEARVRQEQSEEDWKNIEAEFRQETEGKVVKDL